MKPPAQILTALTAAGAAAFLPLSFRFEEAGHLKEEAAKRTAARSGRAGEAPAVTPANKASSGQSTVSGASRDRIPPPASEPDADRIIAELKNADGKMPTSRRLMEMLEGVMSLPESRMEEARAAIEAHKNPVLTGFLCSALFSRWGELNPDGARVALESASKSNNFIMKYAGAASLAGGWIEKDPDAFLKWINEKPEGETEQQQELRRVMADSALRGMANLDSAMAEKLIASSPKERRASMIMDLAEQNPDADPRLAATRALEEAGNDSGQRSSVHWRLARSLADKDPKEALAYAETVKPEERRNYYEAAFSSMLKKDKSEAMKWITGQPEDVQKDAIRGSRWQLNDMSFEETGKMADTLSRGAGEELWFSAINEKASKDPKEAINYLPNVAEDKRQFSYNQIAGEWTKKNPEAASEWVDSLEPGKQKDYAIQGMVQELHSKDPSSSTIWASTVGDEQMRERLVQENANLWLKRDRPAAEEWISNATSLSDSLKEKLLTPPAK